MHELNLNTQDNTEYVDPWSETDGGESTIENRNSQNKENDYTLMGMRTNLKNEVYVNADFIMGREIDINDQKTQNGYFKLLTPTFFGKTLTFLEATKKETEKKEKKKRYRQKFTKAKYREEGIPEYYVKRELFFPRFVKPY